MKNIQSLLFIATVTVFFLTGCGNQKKFKTKTRFCLPNVTKAHAMQTAEDVLGTMHFAVDKADVEMGYIKSRPLRAGQFFEFWRKDNVRRLNKAEANLHTIRRTVEINISQQDQNLCINCDVKTERLSLSDHIVGQNRTKYDRSSRTRTSIQQIGIQAKQKSWIDLGKDEKLATVIAQKIQKQLSKP